jgi:hypothetical protein
VNETPPPEAPNRELPPRPHELPEAGGRQEQGADNFGSNTLLTGCGTVAVGLAVIVLLFLGVCGAMLR